MHQKYPFQSLQAEHIPHMHLSETCLWSGSWFFPCLKFLISRNNWPSQLNKMQFQAHPLAKLYRGDKQREWVAATLQIMLPHYRDTHVTVRFGQPVWRIAQPTGQVIEQMRGLISAAEKTERG